MIYVTGDTHIPIDINKLSTKQFPVQKELGKNDYVIVCGDFGGIWDESQEEKYWIKWLFEKNFTTLFLDGNHDNHKKLSEDYPIVDFCGAKAHKINEKLYHLMRGQVYDIDGMKFFVFGGAESHDKELRVEGKNWWREELPSEFEIEAARENLQKNDWSVDYIITHCASGQIQGNIGVDYPRNVLTTFFDELEKRVDYKKWYFGHYHKDCDIDSKHSAVFQKIIRIK